jgi:hypothetical protein
VADFCAAAWPVFTPPLTGCVGIELVALDDADAVMLPAFLVRVRMVVGVIVVVMMVGQGMDSNFWR